MARTIEIVGLNVERLRLLREKRWQALNHNWREHFDDPDTVESAACSELLPTPGGQLQRLFTTSRSYFAPFGERILEQNTGQWV